MKVYSVPEPDETNEGEAGAADESSTPSPAQSSTTLNSVAANLDALAVAFVSFRKREVGMPDDPADPPLRRMVKETAEFGLGLAEQQKQILEKVEALEEKQRAGQRDWFTVADARVACDWIRELRAWHDSTFRRRMGRQLPACWPWHPRVVSDLLALHSQWVWAYKQANPSAVMQIAAQWWERVDPKKSMTECFKTPAKPFHYDDTTTDEMDVDTNAVPEYVEWWVAGGVHGEGVKVPGLTLRR